MGRKLDLGELTEEEEKAILDVIQRDFTVRKVESDRIGKLSQDVEEEEQRQKEVVKEAVQGEVPINSLCAKCGSKFMWLINPKSQCNGCDLYFCKNKINCIVYDKITKKCFCNACLKQRDLHSYAGDWFYGKLKGKFRRHGGAKVSRELQKNKKSKKTDGASSPAPMKPPRVGVKGAKLVSPPSSASTTPASVRRQPSDASQSGISRTSKEEVNERMDAQEITIQEEYNEQMDAVVIETHLESSPPSLSKSDIEIQTEGLDSIGDKLPEIKEELEAAISKILLPKLDELKRSQIEHQTEVDRQQKVEDAVRLAEEMIDRALGRALEKHAKRPAEENLILEKYLSDSKTELMNKVSAQLHDEASFQQNSARSSLRETGTMTETSDSEMESLSSASGRKRSPRSLPLSERLGNLSPDSLRRSIETNKTSSAFTQGVVLQKNQLVARAEMGTALEQILDEQGVPVSGPTSPQEFSTELKFTAVGGGKRRFPSGEISENSDSDGRDYPEELLSIGDNWSTPELQKRPSQFGKGSNVGASNSMMSLQNHQESPYARLTGGDSDSDDREHVEEEQVLASIVRRPDGLLSPQVLMSPRIDIVESLPEKKPRLPVEVAVDSSIIDSMSKDLNWTNGGMPKEPTLKSPPVQEELIFAVDKNAVESQAPLEEESEILYQDQPKAKLDSRNSSDSAYWSDYAALVPGTPSSESELSAIPEASQEDGYEHGIHSENGESEDSSPDGSARLNRNSFLQPQRLAHTAQAEKIPGNQLSYDTDLITDRDDFGDRIAEMLAQKQMEEQNVPVKAPFNVRESISSISDEETSREKEESSSSSDEEESATPVPEGHQPGIEESAIGLRMVNGKSLEVLTDALERIEDAKKTHSDSGSGASSKTCSVHGDAEEIHKLNEAEEAIYKSAAQTFAMEEHLDQMEKAAVGLNRSDPGLKQMLHDLDEEIEMAESQVEEIKYGGKSIEAIMNELRGAGLQVERGGFKRTSLDSATLPHTQDKNIQPGRQSLPPMTQPLRPVNAPDSDHPSWHKNTFTVIPGSRTIQPLEDLVSHSTPKQAESASSESSHSSGSNTPVRPGSPSVQTRTFRDFKEPKNELEAISLTSLKSSSRSSKSSQASSQSEERMLNDEEVLRTAMRHFSQEEAEKIPAMEQKRPSSAHSSNSSHSTPSSHQVEGKLEAKTAGKVEAKIPVPRHIRPSSAHSTNSSHSAASSHNIEETIEVKKIQEIEASVSSLKSPSAHSQSSTNSHEESLGGVSERRKIFENGAAPSLKSPSSHSTSSINSSSYHSLNGGDKVTLNSNYNSSAQASLIPVLDRSVSSHSAASLHSATTASSEVHSEDEELSRITYQPGLTAQELEEARVPTPVPRTKKEVLKIEETTVLPAPEPRERRKSNSAEHHEVAEGVLPAAGVQKIVNRLEGKKTSSDSSSSDESGGKYSEPLIKEGLRSTSNKDSDEIRKKVLKRRKILPHQPNSTESEGSDGSEGKKVQRRSRILKDDSWLRDSDGESGASKRSVDTARSSRSGLFHNLSASEQREMARIALLHCEETAIAEDKFQTKTINFVRKQEDNPSFLQNEVAPALQVSPSVPEIVVQEQKEILPTLAPHDIRTVAEVHIERTSSVSSGSSTESAKKIPAIQVAAPPIDSSSPSLKQRGTASDKASSGHTIVVTDSSINSPSRNSLHVMESVDDLDRGQNFRGSITMRGGKMVMTSSPDSKPEFQTPLK